jgi:hypothetical protein
VRGEQITANGISDTVTGWAARLGVPRQTIYARLYADWEPARAVTEPPRVHHRGKKPPCVRPDCERDVMARGLCRLHYNRFIREVKRVRG